MCPKGKVLKGLKGHDQAISVHPLVFIKVRLLRFHRDWETGTFSFFRIFRRDGSQVLEKGISQLKKIDRHLKKTEKGLTIARFQRQILQHKGGQASIIRFWLQQIVNYFGNLMFLQAEMYRGLGQSRGMAFGPRSPTGD